MKIVILGGAGYIGSRLAVEAIASGYNVIIIDNLMYHQDSTPYQQLSDKLELLHRDVRAVNSYAAVLDSADVVIHLAAIVGAPACAAHQALARTTNTDSVAAVLARLRHQTFIYPNTNSGYGTTAGDACTEDTPLAPISVYGQTKLEGECLALAYPHTVALRLATVFGWSPRMRLDLIVNQFSYDAFFSRNITVFGGAMRRNFVYVGDVVRLILFAINTPAMHGHVYNVGNDSLNMTKSQLATVIAAEFGATVTDVIGSDPDKRDYIVSNQRLSAAGFVCRTGLDYGLKELRDWMETLPTDPEARTNMIKHMNTTCI